MDGDETRSRDYAKTEDVREDGVEHVFNILDGQLAELDDAIQRLGNKARPYLRPETASPMDPNMMEKRLSEASEIGNRLRNVQDQVNKCIRAVGDITRRIDD